MSLIFEALLPILTLILVGFLIQRTSFLPATFWPAAEKLTYFLLTPALLIHILASKSIGALPWKEILFTVEGTVLISATLLTLWWLMVRRRIDGPAFTSLFQGGVRFNTFVALALSEALFGTDGLVIAALGASFMILLINLLCVSVFSLTVDNSAISFRSFFMSLARNPLIIGCVIGGALNLSELGVTPAVDGILAMGGKAAFPLGLMAVGAAYRTGNLLNHWEALTVSSLVQFCAKPFIAWSLGTALGLSGVAASVAILLFSVPTAPSAYILSRQMGGDHESMSSIITLQTGLSFITLPITLALIF